MPISAIQRAIPSDQPRIKYKGGIDDNTTGRKSIGCTGKSSLDATRANYLQPPGCMQSPHNQRALALLAIDDGNSPAQAAGQVGLTVNQVKYWLPRFRKHRLDILPSVLMAEVIEPAVETDLGETMDKTPGLVTEGKVLLKTRKGKRNRKKTLQFIRYTRVFPKTGKPKKKIFTPQIR